VRESLGLNGSIGLAEEERPERLAKSYPRPFITEVRTV